MSNKKCKFWEKLGIMEGSMNLNQKICLWVGTIVIVYMCFYPPYFRILEIRGERIFVRPFSNDYDGNILSPPQSLFETEQKLIDGKWQTFNKDYVKIDTPRLVIQCIIIALITFAMICSFSGSKLNTFNKIKEKK